MCSISKSIICHRIETIRNISIYRCILTILYRISRRIKLHINVGQKKIAGIYFEISFVLPILCHHKITVCKLQSNINADLLLMSHWQKKIDDAAEQHMRSMLPRECTISTFRTQINVIFCRMRMCCFFFSSFQTQNIYFMRNL